jgi:hypothetical protein
MEHSGLFENFSEPVNMRRDLRFRREPRARVAAFICLVCSIFGFWIVWSIVHVFPGSRVSRPGIGIPYEKYSLTRECALSFVSSLSWEFRPSWNPSVAYDGVFVTKYGSLGNQVITFVNARYFAAATVIPRIFCHSEWLGFPDGEYFKTQDGVEIFVARDEFHTPYPRSLLLSGSFFFSPAVCEDWSWKDVLDGVTDFLRKSFPPLNLSEHELVIVLRGGIEMWIAKGRSLCYMQAPCRFFLDIMTNFSSTLVIGGDGSPCMNMTIEAGGRWIPWNETEGTRYMLYARNVAFSRTSRSHAMIALAPFWRRFWLFDVESERKKEWWWRGFKPYEFGEGYDCVASSEYRRIGSPWVPTEEQIQQVRNGSCEFRRIDPS